MKVATRPTDAFFGHICQACDANENVVGMTVDGEFVRLSRRALKSLRAALAFLDENEHTVQTDRICRDCHVNIRTHGDLCQWCYSDTEIE